ncbi:hypothetical_protein [Leishmania braziliensis MHOM/BR/75/M2904]|uniref:Hypothetical_protein n=1 Tax=Leishmania braziliensis MHOM/BR/75/M2904 TaxID=420245 RepID=A0A3P3Z9L5_LEIBR|nr:hypothetical_protein [Leishmania braziliensis MHOM/BR/75/M2904]
MAPDDLRMMVESTSKWQDKVVWQLTGTVASQRAEASGITAGNSNSLPTGNVILDWATMRKGIGGEASPLQKPIFG